MRPVSFPSAPRSNFPPCGSGVALVHVGDGQSFGIHPRRVPAAMIDQHRMVRRRRIQIRLGQRAAVGRLGVVVLESDHPLARRQFWRHARESPLEWPRWIANRNPLLSDAASPEDAVCRCASMNPGSTVWPPRSIRLVAGGRQVVRFRPWCQRPESGRPKSRRPALAGLAGSMVWMFPLKRMRSARMLVPQSAPPRSATEAPNIPTNRRRLNCIPVLSKFRLTLIGDLTIQNCVVHVQVQDVLGRRSQRIARQYHQIGQFAGLDAATCLLLKSRHRPPKW